MIARVAQVRSLIWLSSYPKSGNTWLRAMLSLLTDPDRLLDLNRLPFGMDLFDRQVLDDFAGVSTGTMTVDELIPYQAKLFSAVSREGSPPNLAKTHAAAIASSRGTRMFDIDATAGAIYLVRNPFDVAVSYAHHSAYSVDETIELMGDSNATLHKWSDKGSTNLPQLMKSWSDHAASWIDNTDFPVLLIRYEDMLADTQATLANIAQFCRLDVGPDTVAGAVERCQFNNLKGVEETQGFNEKPSVNRAFFRVGHSGEGARALTGAQIKRILLDHNSIMQRLKYAAPDPSKLEGTYG